MVSSIVSSVVPEKMPQDDDAAVATDKQALLPGETATSTFLVFLKSSTDNGEAPL